MPAYEREVLGQEDHPFLFPDAGGDRAAISRRSLNEDARKRLPQLLEEPDTAEELASKMDTALAALPLDFLEYEERAETLGDP